MSFGLQGFSLSTPKITLYFKLGALSNIANRSWSVRTTLFGFISDKDFFRDIHFVAFGCSPSLHHLKNSFKIILCSLMILPFVEILFNSLDIVSLSSSIIICLIGFFSGLRTLWNE